MQDARKRPVDGIEISMQRSREAFQQALGNLLTSRKIRVEQHRSMPTNHPQVPRLPRHLVARFVGPYMDSLDDPNTQLLWCRLQDQGAAMQDLLDPASRQFQPLTSQLSLDLTQGLTV